MEKKRYDIFISHSHVNQEIALNLCTVLEQKGVSCWIAPRNVGVGHYSSAIVEGIENSKAMVLLLSSHSNNSTPVLNELESATNNNLMIIPVRIEDVLPTKSIGYYIRTNNWFDNFNPTSMTDFENVAETIKSAIDSNNTITKRFISPTVNKSKVFSFKTLTFVLLFILSILSIAYVNSYATTVMQEKTIKRQDKIINQYQKLLEANRDNPKTISQAEHIKDIAGYKEAIKYFKSKDKELFYANYKNILWSGNGSIITQNNSYGQPILHRKFTLSIKTKPISSNIKIVNSKIKYKNNILVDRGIYTIEISSNGYNKKIFNIKIDKDIHLDVDLESIEEIKE